MNLATAPSGESPSRFPNALSLNDSPAHEIDAQDIT